MSLDRTIPGYVEHIARKGRHAILWVSIPLAEADALSDRHGGEPSKMRPARVVLGFGAPAVALAGIKADLQEASTEPETVVDLPFVVTADQARVRLEAMAINPRPDPQLSDPDEGFHFGAAVAEIAALTARRSLLADAIAGETKSLLVQLGRETLDDVDDRLLRAQERFEAALRLAIGGER